MFIKKAAVVAVALAGQAFVEGAEISKFAKRDGGGHGHGHAAAAAPASGYGAPAPASGYGAPAPASGYGAPAPASSYGAPADSYGAPADSYGAPEPAYAAAPSYEAEQPVYGATGAEVEEAGPAGPGILPFVAVILSIIGLSLLFPAVVNISGRKKRSLGEEPTMIERVNDIYGAVLESEECMEKIACELGAMTKDLTSNFNTGMLEAFVPSRYSQYYKQFKAGTKCEKIPCGKAF